MDSRFGPIRLIALHCGKFDYAEIELDQPLHLVGPNNVGKTSLISLLQFLYLDDQRSMRFSRELQETRKYYFPGVHSYALFECLTPTGYQTVGVRGLGPVKQYEFERFSYMGRFDETLFLDEDRCVREADAIKADLASRNFTLLTPRVLRAALTGVGDGHKVMLGLVPAQNRDTYASFKELFCNILRLSHIRQDEMKTLLLTLFARSFHQPDGIDLAKTYQENFEKVKRDTKAVQTVKELVPDIERALEHRSNRDAARNRLPSLHKAVMNAAQSVQNDLQHERAAATQRSQLITAKLATSETESETANEQLISCTTALARFDDWFAETERLERELIDFLPDWCEQRIHEIGKRSDDLARRLGNLSEESPAEVQARLSRQQLELERLQERLANIEHVSYQKIRQYFTSDQLADAFRLLNPDLLGLSVDVDASPIQIRDNEMLRQTLQRLIEHCEEQRFSGSGVAVDLQALHPPDFEAYGDPAHIENAMARLVSAIQRDEQRCRDAEEADVLRQEKSQLEQEKQALLIRRQQYELLCTRREAIDEHQSKRNVASTEEARLKALLQTLKETMRALMHEQQNLERELERLQTKAQQIQLLLADIIPPEEAWVREDAEPVNGTLEDLAARYKKDYFDQQRQHESLCEILGSIEERTYSTMTGKDEAESLAKLEEARDALPEKEQAAAELWKSIAVGIRENLQNMGSDLDTLRTKVNRVNRGLAAINVSNLKSIRLTIVDNPQWIKRIKSIRLQDDMPLFADQGSCDAAFAEIGRLLSERSRIELGDLFNLEFEITMPDDSVRKYPHLDRIESNGTTIAIKVLVNLSLLKQLLNDADVTVPFYLDECSSLDTDNLQAIVKTAHAMGFVAVLASPEAMDAAARIYFIHEKTDGRVVLDPRQALVECLDSAGDANA